MVTKVLRLARLHQKLRALPTAARDAMQRALAEGATEIVALARSLAPDDDGDLKASIDWSVGDPPPDAVLGRGKKKVGAAGSIGAELRVSIYAGNETAFYARWVEFGTAPHAQPRRGTMHPGAQAKPFFFPAYRALRKRVKGKAARGIRQAVKAVAKRG